MRFAAGEYAELLGLYLGDGDISLCRRSHRLRISLDSRHPQLIADAHRLVVRCMSGNRVGVTPRRDGRTVLWVYSKHLPCLFPQHGAGPKHKRRILLERWQEECIRRAPWSFLRGLVHTDGCFFINRTGRYGYLSVSFVNRSRDLLTLFANTCEIAGVDCRPNAASVRVYDRRSVAEFAAFVGSKR